MPSYFHCIFSGGGVSFPNFRRFYLQEGGFDFSVPAADLELSLFSINEEARNFPEEAVEERLAKERNRRRSKRHIPGEFLGGTKTQSRTMAQSDLPIL